MLGWIVLAAAINWTLPTVLGALAVSLRPGELHWDEGTLVARRPSSDASRSRWAFPVPPGASAITIGCVIAHRGDVMSARLRRHERTHVVQYALLGALFFVWYLGEYAARRVAGATHHDAYRALTLERWARRAEANVTDKG